MAGSKVSALADIGALAPTDLMYFAKDIGGGFFLEKKGQVSLLDARYQGTLGFTPENAANKDTDITLAANSDVKYASQKATKAYVDALAAASSAAFVLKAGDTMTGLLSFSGTTHAGIKLNNLTTVQRDALTPAAGDIIWNTNTLRVNTYDGTDWVTGYVKITGDSMSGPLQFTSNSNYGIAFRNLSTASRNALISPAAGACIFNVNTAHAEVLHDTLGPTWQGLAYITGDIFTGQLSFSGTTNPGLKINNLTTTQRDALTGAQGMLIANTTTTLPNYFNGSAWVVLGDALTANPLSQFAATSSAQLAGVLSDETGTGVSVFNINPTIAGATFSDRLHFSGTGHIGIEFNTLTTAQRNAITAGAGSAIFNSTTGRIEFATALNTWNTYALLSGDTFTGNVLFAENTGIQINSALTADGKYVGIIEQGTAGEALAFGVSVYQKTSDSRWYQTDADADNTAGAVRIGICVLAAAGAASATTILLYGKVRADAQFPTFTVGVPVYLSTTTGALTVTQPSGTDDVIRIVGYGTTGDELFFNPSNDYMTHT